MHILLVHQAFASLDDPGGTRHYEFACMLAARGHHVTIIASAVNYITGAPSGVAGASRPPDGVTILRANVYAAHHKSFAHRMVAFFAFMVASFWLGLWIRDVDLVWGTSPPIFQGVTAWLLARLKGAKFMFEVRDLWPQFAVAVGVLKQPRLIAASEWLERFLYRRADCVIVNSPGFVAHVRDRGGRHVELIPNGADPEMFDPKADGAEFRRANSLDDKFVALYAGAHGVSNDLETVIDGAKLLADSQIQVVFVGDGKEKPALVAYAASLGLTTTTFVASVAKRDMPAILAGADACIAILKPLPEYRTTYPNKVFDYMAAGRPVIVAIDGAIREVVHAADCGVFVQPGSPSALAAGIRSLAADRERARRLGMNGRRYVEQHFSRAHIAAQLERILEGILE